MGNEKVKLLTCYIVPEVNLITKNVKATHANDS